MRVDHVGLMLMLLWIAALQIMLDLGREHDWFNDPTIVVLGIVALIGFAVFIAWEVTEKQPIVDLRVFRHRGFSVAVASLAFAFATFFSTIVIIPQWLQTSMGYTATYAGYAMAFMGVAAVIMSPIVAKLSTKYDPRMLVCFGICWLGAVSLLRVHWNSQADFLTLAIPQMLQGFGMPFFFIPVMSLALAAVDPEETASAAGVMNFLRTMAGAIGTSISTTMWDNSARVARSEIVSTLDSGPTVDALAGQGFSLDQARVIVAQLVERESLMLASTHVFLIASIVFGFAAMIIWLAPRPKRVVQGGGGH
jgi:DHA2 family multidrug resistance protein